MFFSKQHFIGALIIQKAFKYVTMGHVGAIKAQSLGSFRGGRQATTLASGTFTQTARRRPVGSNTLSLRRQR